MLFVLLILLIIVMVGSTPHFGLHSYGWGPSGILGVILIILLVLFVLGRH